MEHLVGGTASDQAEVVGFIQPGSAVGGRIKNVEHRSQCKRIIKYVLQKRLDPAIARVAHAEQPDDHLMDKRPRNRNGEQHLIACIPEFIGGGFQRAVLLRMNRRAAAVKISRDRRDGLLATDRLKRHRAFRGSGNTVAGDFLQDHLYSGQVVGTTFFHTPQNPQAATGECSRQMNHPQNWTLLLPYLATGAHLIEPTLLANVVEFFDHSATMGEAEQGFPRIDPVLVRTAVIAGLHGGQIISPDLVTLAFSRHTRVSRYRRGQTHEAQ
jgi:hypothetical protein